MKKLTLLLMLGLCTQPCLAGDAVLQAMHDEMARSMQGLKLPPSPLPYWMAYRIQDVDSWDMNATLGAMTRDSHEHGRSGSADVRIGSFKLDSGGTMFVGLPVSLDDNYAALRRQLWQLADQGYKRAVATWSNRQTEVAELAHAPTSPDFSPATAVTHLEASPALHVDAAHWRHVLRDLSAGFVRSPGLLTSSAHLSITASTSYLVTSEGTTVKSGAMLARLVLRAQARSADGKVMQDVVACPVHRLEDLPPEAVLARERDAMAARLIRLCQAPKEKRYIGPVLITGPAAPQFLAEILGPRLSGERTGAGLFSGSDLSDRLQRRILPTFVDVVDDPTLSEWQGLPLFGTYAIDAQGVPAQRVVLVHQGRLKTLLMGRRPAQQFPHSNGHARTPTSVTFSNLICTTQSGDSFEGLKRKLRDECKKQQLPYGLLIRNLEDVDAGGFGMAALMARFAGIGGPMQVYRVDTATGQEHLVRTGGLADLNLRTLRDIMAAGQDAHAMVYMSAGDAAPPSTVVAPSLLLEELEIKPYEGEETAARPVLHPPGR